MYFIVDNIKLIFQDSQPTKFKLYSPEKKIAWNPLNVVALFYGFLFYIKLYVWNINSIF